MKARIWLWMRRLAAAGLLIGGLAPGASAGPVDFDLGLQEPPVVVDSKAPPACTVAWLVINYVTNDIFVSRARIARGDDEKPVAERMPCPAPVPVRVAERALNVCTDRALDPKHCVYADMSRGFEVQPDIHKTAENAARCSSDKALHIGVACWMAGGMAVCDSGCGDTPEAAEEQAVARCQDKQQRSCPIKASVPVIMP